MKFEQIIEKFRDLSERRSRILKSISDMENEITSISERLDELRGEEGDKLAPKDKTDQISRARDKRKRVRSDVSAAQHDVRMIETEISTLKMRFKWLVDYEVTNGE